MEKVKGFYAKVFYENTYDGYKMVSIRCPEGIVKVSGKMPDYPAWTPLDLEVVRDGDRLNVMSIKETTLDVPLQGVENLLMQAGMIAVEAQAIAREYSNLNLYEALFDYEFKQQLRNRYGARTVTIMEEGLQIPRLKRLTNELLQIPYSKTNPFVSQYGTGTFYQLKRFPYTSMFGRLGMSIEKVDEIVRLLKADRSDRNQAIIAWIADRNETNGNTAISYDSLMGIITEKFPDIQLEHFAQALQKADVIRINTPYGDYLGKITTFNAEKILQEEMEKVTKPLFLMQEIQDCIEKLQKELGIKYAEAQKQAFQLLSRSGIAILTGGPGTGKTTVLNGLIKAWKSKYGDKIVLCSPTGRAAQRMAEATGMEAQTIHRLLSIGGNEFSVQEKLDADLIVVDESSMLDSELTGKLIRAKKDDALLLLVGDIDQLPSVGAGDVLKNIIDSGKVPVCKLKTVYRQTGESKIVVNANRINRGVAEIETDNTFEHLDVSDSQIPATVLMKVKEKVKASSLFDVQVLCTTHKGKSGIDALNTLLQNEINPRKTGMRAIRYGVNEFRIGDKVITTQNNYTAGYYNGDIGQVVKIEDDGMTISFPGKSIKIEKKNLGDVSLAYCISIHKSQGSEFPIAIIVLPEENKIMLKRNLLYTAITRAKRECYIVGTKAAIKTCAQSSGKGRRITLMPYIA